MEVSEETVRKIVEEVVKESTLRPSTTQTPPALSGERVLFDSMSDAIEAARESQLKLAAGTLELRSKIIRSMRNASLKYTEELAREAREETKLGRSEDKVIKNRLAAEKTPGIEDIQPIAFSGDHGLTLVEKAPYGVIGSITPSTNPTSTIINNSISIIAAGNSVVFAPHPAARKCSQHTMLILDEAILSAGGPPNLITSVKKPSIEEAGVLFEDHNIKLLLVTGGPAVASKAMESHKKVVVAGPGNPPVVVDETANIEMAMDSIIKGASFDNGILCTAEKEVIMVEAVAEKLLDAMRKDLRAYELTPEQMDKVSNLIIQKPWSQEQHPVLNRDYLGRDASVIARAVELEVPPTVRLLWGEVPNDHNLVWTEQLSPVLPFTRMPDVDTAIEFAVKVEENNHHTFVMHSLNIENLSKMAKKCQASIFVKNGPSYMGLGMGEGFAALSIATPTGDGLTKASTFTRPLRCVLVDYFRIV